MHWLSSKAMERKNVNREIRRMIKTDWRFRRALKAAPSSWGMKKENGRYKRWLQRRRPKRSERVAMGELVRETEKLGLYN